MWDLLKPYYVELLKIAWNDGTDTVGEVVGVFDLENTYVQTVLQDLAKRVKGIEETTRDEIRNVIGQVGREGLSVDQAQARLLEMAEINSTSRAEMIARTESAHGYSAGSMAYYKESGVVGGMEWLTTDPCPICAPLDGAVAPLGTQFAGGFDHPPAHPNCRCAVAPVLKAEPQPERTLAEERAWAIEHTAEEVGSFDVGVLREINEARATMEAKGYKLPHLISLQPVADSQGPSRLGLAQADKIVWIRPDADERMRLAQEKYNKHGGDAVLNVGGTIRSIAAHEFMHTKVYNLPEAMQNRARAQIDHVIRTEGSEVFGKYISVYASTNADEVLSEAAAMLVEGIPFPKEIAWVGQLAEAILKMDLTKR